MYVSPLRIFSSNIVINCYVSSLSSENLWASAKELRSKCHQRTNQFSSSTATPRIHPARTGQSSLAVSIQEEVRTVWICFIGRYLISHNSTVLWWGHWCFDLQRRSHNRRICKRLPNLVRWRWLPNPQHDDNQFESLVLWSRCESLGQQRFVPKQWNSRLGSWHDTVRSRVYLWHGNHCSYFQSNWIPQEGSTSVAIRKSYNILTRVKQMMTSNDLIQVRCVELSLVE